MGAGGGICACARAELRRPGFRGGGGGSCEDFSGGLTTGTGAGTTTLTDTAGFSGVAAAFGAGLAGVLTAAFTGTAGFFGAGLAAGVALTAGFFAAGFTGALDTGFLAAAGLAVFLATGFGADLTTAFTTGLATVLGFALTAAFATALPAGLAAALTGVFDFCAVFAGFAGFAGAFTRCLLWIPPQMLILWIQQKTWLQPPYAGAGRWPGYCSRRAIVAAGREAGRVLKQTVGESIQT